MHRVDSGAHDQDALHLRKHVAATCPSKLEAWFLRSLAAEL